MAMNNWHGWIIEQSLGSQSIFEQYKTVGILVVK